MNPYCGDGKQDLGEQCAEPGLSCPVGQTCNQNTCLCSGGGLCGNSKIDQGEQCGEPGLACPAGQTCDKGWCLCTGGAKCGDGKQDLGEQCAEPGLSCPAGQTCSQNTCLCSGGPYCGNGKIERGELCGEPGLSCGTGQTCNPNNCLCVAPATLFFICGDGKTDPGEECDDGNNRDHDGCGSTCWLEMGYCGDGRVQLGLGEQCEPSSFDRSLSYTCAPNCRFSSYTCGDGRVDAGEECDEGSRNADVPNAHCRTTCSFDRCGDRILDSLSEQCDDGNRLDGDGCDKFCRNQSAAASSAPGRLVNGVFVPNQSSQPGQGTAASRPATGVTPVDDVLGAVAIDFNAPTSGVNRPTLGIDPVTGKPALGTDPATGKPVIGFDPASGRVIIDVDPSNGRPVVGYDPNGDTPVYAQPGSTYVLPDGTIVGPGVTLPNGARIDGSASLNATAIQQRKKAGALDPTGPGIIAVMAAGAAGGYAWMRRRRK